MRKINIIAVFVLFMAYFVAYGQEVINNFQVDNGEIVWQKVYETDLSFEQLAEQVKDAGLLDKTEVGENKILGVLKPIDADYKGAGITPPIYMYGNQFAGFVVIDFKEGKYRATIKKIVLVQKVDDPYHKQGYQTNFEIFAVKSGTNEMKSPFKKTQSPILDYTFSKKFDFKETSKKDDW